MFEGIECECVAFHHPLCNDNGGGRVPLTGRLVNNYVAGATSCFKSGPGWR